MSDLILKSPITTPIRSDAVRYAVLAADRLGFQVQMLDLHSGYLCRIGNGGRSVLVGGGNLSAWPVNSVTSANVASDKAFTSLVLREFGTAVPDDVVVFLSDRFKDLRAPGHEVSDLGSLANRLSWPVIAKPNNGSRGAFVRYCASYDELEKHLQNMAQRYESAILQNFISGTEYRVFVFGGEALFGYRKSPGALVTDGESSIRALLESMNKKLLGSGLDPIDPNSSYVKKSMNGINASLDSVLAPGIHIEVGARANLSAGGKPEEFTTKPQSQLADVAIRAAGALGLVAAGVDIIVSNDKPKQPLVLEVNGNPAVASLETLGRIDLAVEIYEKQLVRLLCE